MFVFMCFRQERRSVSFKDQAQNPVDLLSTRLGDRKKISVERKIVAKPEQKSQNKPPPALARILTLARFDILSGG